MSRFLFRLYHFIPNVQFPYLLNGNNTKTYLTKQSTQHLADRIAITLGYFYYNCLE